MAINTQNAAFYGDFSSLAALKKDAKTQSAESVRAAAQQFESLFTNMLLKSMRSAGFGDSLTGGSDVEFYQGMFDQQLAVQLSKGKGLGLADMLVQQLTRSGMVSDASDNKSSTARQITTNTLPTTSAATTGVAAMDAVTARTRAVNTLQALISTASDSDAASSSLSSLLSSMSVSSSSSPSLNVATTSGNANWPPKSPQAFVEQLLPQAQAAAQQLGVDPCMLVAHAALETGWGQHVPQQADGSSSFNLFGIKASQQWQGGQVAANTLEYEQGVAVNKVERFKSYGSVDECFADYAQLLGGSSRYAAARGAGSAAQFAQALQAGGYATDPHYADKLNSVANAVNSMAQASGANADS